MADLPLSLWIAFAGVLGLVVGSFLNVVILRTPERLEALWRRDARELLGLASEDASELPPGVVREPSHCPQCKHSLAIIDNIPLVSWLLLLGRCRYCKSRISAQYPAVEFACGVLSAFVVWKLGPTWPTLAALLFTWMLVALAGIDIRTQLLPDQLTLPLLWVGLLLSLFSMFTSPSSSIIGAVFGYLSLWSVYWIFKLLTGKEGMGFGDFKLLAAAGAWMGPTALLPIVLISSLVGAIVGGLLIVFRQHQREAPIPFGPYLAAAAWIWLMAGGQLTAFYSNLFFLKG